MKFLNGCLFSLSFLFLNLANAGGTDRNPDYDLSLSSVVGLAGELSSAQDQQLTQAFADRLFTFNQDKGKGYQIVLDEINLAIKHTGSQISCDSRKDTICVINGNEINLSYSFYPDSWSACTSNSIASAKGFILDVASNKLIAQKHKQSLINTRFLQLFKCEYLSKELPSDVVNNDITSAYYLYLNASQSLYNNQYAESHKILEKIQAQLNTQTNNDSWLKEAVSYMFGRIALLRAQKQCDFWSESIADCDGLDNSYSAQSIEYFEKYKKAYPQGRWVYSAQGLIGRANYFFRQKGQENEAYINALKNRLVSIVTQFSDVELGHSRLHDTFYEFSRFTDLPHDELLELLSKTIDLNPSNQELAKTKQEIEFYLKIIREPFNKDIVSSAVIDQFKAKDILSSLLAIKLINIDEYDSAFSLLLKYQNSFMYKSDVNTLISRALMDKGGILDVLAFSKYAESEYYEGNSIIKNLYLTSLCNYEDLEDFANNDLNSEKLDNDTKERILRELYGFYLEVGNFDSANQIVSLFDKEYGEYKVNFKRLNASNSESPINYLLAGKWLGKHRSPRFCDSLSGKDIDVKTSKNALHYLIKGFELAEKQANKQLAPEFLHVLTFCSKSGYYGYKCNSGFNHTYPATDNIPSPKHWFRLLHKKYPNSQWTDKTPYYYGEEYW